MVQTDSTTDHDALIKELTRLETINPEERLCHARERRTRQLSLYEARLSSPSWKSGEKVDHAKHKKNIRFESNIELIEAAARDDAEEVGTFVKNGVSPNLQNEDGLSGLHQAVIEDCEDVVDVLVEHGADLDIKDADLWTPLHAAVACGNYHLVKYLVEKGASLIEINTDGNMPIDLVDDNIDIELFLDQAMIDAGYTEEDLENVRNETASRMLEDLRETFKNNKSLNLVGDLGETPMHIAAANGYCDVVEYLLDHGGKIDMRDNDFWQPIHAAACWGQDKIIEILVRHGADLDALTKDGETPIDLTEDEDLQGMIIELKESGHKTKELKRSQSNSSRTLSVRRSSIVEKRQKSLNDAKQEGMYRQNPDFLHVDIKTGDDDGNLEESGSNDEQFDNQSVVDVDAIQNPVEKILISKENCKTKSNTANCDSVTYHSKQDEVKLQLEKDKIEADNNYIGELVKPNTLMFKSNDISIDIKSSDLEEEKPTLKNYQSHNTAAKKSSTKLTQSTESAVKKKCCIIL